MYRLGRLAQLCANTKTSTGLTGVPVVANAREVLLGLYAKTLEDVKMIPESAEYRKGVDQITRFRMKVVEENEDCTVIENLIQDGMVEELIEQAEAELELIPEMAEWKLWEAPEGTAEPDIQLGPETDKPGSATISST